MKCQPVYKIHAVILLAAAMIFMGADLQAAVFAQLDSSDTVSGYLARLLINEVPFPGERGFESEAATKQAMVQILWVLHGRIHLIPQGYTQQQIAGVRSQSIIDVITGTEDRRQCEGFYKNSAGKFVTDDRVDERIDYLLKIANKGSKPGRFSSLLNFGQNLASAYVNEGIEGADLFSDLKWVGRIEVTGRAYSWMTDINNYHPGGNFVSIPTEEDGSIGGNRFFSLRLPRGTFIPYANAQANVIFLQKGTRTKKVWIYDCRSNIPGCTKKDRPLTGEMFADFEKCYGKDPDGTSKRTDTGDEGRFRCFGIDEIKERGYKLDIKWLKDDTLDDPNDLPEPTDLIAEAVTELEAVVDELNDITLMLGNGNE